jgi:hypothetical protein
VVETDQRAEWRDNPAFEARTRNSKPKESFFAVIRFQKNAAASLISCAEHIRRKCMTDIMHLIKPIVNFEEIDKFDKFAQFWYEAVSH